MYHIETNCGIIMQITRIAEAFRKDQILPNLYYYYRRGLPLKGQPRRKYSYRCVGNVHFLYLSINL